jgi:hypothetical protein
MPRTITPDTAKQSQIDKFRDAAREHETDDREEVFDRALRVVANTPPKEPEPPKKRSKT